MNREQAEKLYLPQNNSQFHLWSEEEMKKAVEFVIANKIPYVSIDTENQDEVDDYNAIRFAVLMTSEAKLVCDMCFQEAPEDAIEDIDGNCSCLCHFGQYTKRLPVLKYLVELMQDMFTRHPEWSE